MAAGMFGTGRRPRGQQSQGGRLQQSLGGGGAHPHVSWWGEEGVPHVGGSVQVLHEDGLWYPGKLTHRDGEKWHIDFEDGDKDIYTLPHRDVKVMRQRPASGDEWSSFLKQCNVPGPSTSREMLRDQFCSSIQKQLKEAQAARYRKPSETYNGDGTPKEHARSALPPYPHGTSSSACADANGKGIFQDSVRRELSELNFSNFLGSEPDEETGSRKRMRRECQFSDGIRQRYPEAKLYAQLQELERKVDSVSTRKRMQVEEALKHPGTCTRTLQIIVWNTFENQPGAHQDESDTGQGVAQPHSTVQDTGDPQTKPSWTIFVTGRLVDSNGEEVKGEGQATLASLLERVFIQLPAHLYPDSHAIEWNCWDGGSKGKPAMQKQDPEEHVRAPPLGFRVKREGSEECKVRVMLHCTSNPKRFSLSSNPELGELLGFESGSWSQLLLAFWTYVQDHSLHSDDDVLHLKLDEPLRQIFGEERLALRRVSERLSEMATQEEPIEMMYSLRLQGEPKPMVFEALVQVEDPVMHHMRELVQSISQAPSSLVENELDEQIAVLVGEVESHKRRRDFMAAFAERPLPFMHDLVCRLALDLGTIRCEGSSRYCGLGEEDLDRAVAWQQPWTEEAVMHYLNMQGYQVPLQMEDCLLEEDALAIAAQDAAVKYGGQLSKEALARNPPVVPGAVSNPGLPVRAAGRGGGGGGVGGDGEGEWLCEKCDRRFKSHHALSVHYATSAAHKDEKNELKAAGWKPEAGSGLADASSSVAAAAAAAASTAAAVTMPAAGVAAGGADNVTRERKQTAWNDLQRQLKGKGYSQEVIKNIYKQHQSQDATQG